MRQWTGLLLLALAPVCAESQATGASASPGSPVAGLEWLVGGVWTADASKLAPGIKQIETRYRWSDNTAYVRFTTHFVGDQGTTHTYDGSLFWDPGLSTLRMWYMDAGNEITQGQIALNGQGFVLTFRGRDFQGKTADLRVQITRRTSDRYQWLFEEQQGAAWQQLAALEYFRHGDP
jgi:hypothetical protein